MDYKGIKDLGRTTRFNALLYGFKKAIAIAIELRKNTEILETDNYKEIGSIDEDFVDLKYEYRKLIHHHW
ncbi:hypothetical protein [Flavobacterium cellulosilyticum]|uniref:hypothetical protein n=1 Tax=Flavobacterium cellulosilyticum TaxID=2541731 RepID=UPI001FE6DAF5|nr:hypothetical protein [Flavobacterium cellulosilyticum]